jgi:hypothetical protein
VVGLIIFNAIMVALAASVATQILPTRVFSTLLVALHQSIGITTPAPGKVKMVALIWIAFLLLIVDGMLLLLNFLVKSPY